MNTSYGPVMSSCVMSGNSSRPMWKGMGAVLYWRMIFSENRHPSRIKSGTGVFGIMR